MSFSLQAAFKYADGTPVKNGIIRLLPATGGKFLINGSGTDNAVPADIVLNLDVNGGLNYSISSFIGSQGGNTSPGPFLLSVYDATGALLTQNQSVTLTLNNPIINIVVGASTATLKTFTGVFRYTDAHGDLVSNGSLDVRVGFFSYFNNVFGLLTDVNGVIYVQSKITAPLDANGNANFSLIGSQATVDVYSSSGALVAKNIQLTGV